MADQEGAHNMFTILRDMDHEDGDSEEDEAAEREVQLMEASFDANTMVAKIREEVQRSNVISQRMERFRRITKDDQEQTGGASVAGNGTVNGNAGTHRLTGTTEALNSVIDDILQGSYTSRVNRSDAKKTPQNPYNTRSNNDSSAADGMVLDLRDILSHMETKKSGTINKKERCGKKWDFSGVKATEQQEQKEKTQLAEKLSNLHKRDEEDELFSKIKGKGKKGKSKILRAEDVNLRVKNRVSTEK